MYISNLCPDLTKYELTKFVYISANLNRQWMISFFKLLFKMFVYIIIIFS